MRHYRLKIDKTHQWVGTRKYSRIDVFDLHRLWILKRLPKILTELTFSFCSIEADDLHALLAKISGNLQLLILEECTILRKAAQIKQGKALQHPLVHFQKLDTLILVDLPQNSNLFVLFTIRATNLTELGVITTETRLKKQVAKLFVELVENNVNLKILHVAEVATELLLESVWKHSGAKWQLEDLSLSFQYDDFEPPLEPDYRTMALGFFETQRKTLKSCRLDNFQIQQRDMQKLLSLNLVRLELFCCNLQLQKVYNNTSIKILSVVDFHGQPTISKSFANLLHSCKRLPAFVATSEKARLFYFSQFSKPWCQMSTIELPKDRILWANLRSLRYNGVWHAICFANVNPEDLIYYNSLRKTPVEQDPYSIIQLKRIKTVEEEKAADDVEDLKVDTLKIE